MSVAANLEDPDGFYGMFIILIDPVGPISPKPISGYSPMWLIYDIGSSYQWLFFSETNYDIGSSYQWFFFSETKRSSVVVEIVRQIIADLSLRFFVLMPKISSFSDV